MAWITPIFDRTVADTVTARQNQANENGNKGALNFHDLNRIEGNFRYLEEHLKADGVFIPRNFRNYTETTYQMVEKKKLPDGYTQVEYIESTGTQYIDTEIEPNQDTKVVIDALYTQDSNASFLFGSDAGSATKSFGFGAANGNLRIAYNNVSTYFANGLSFANKIHVVVDKNVATINNQYSVSGTYATFEPNYSVWLFGNNRQGTLYGGKDGTRIYSCEIYDNDTIVRDFVPCIKGEGTDSVAGLYDLVNGVFYTNAGTGVFSIGNTVQPEIVYEMQETKTTYTDWQEQNLPWLSEINRIRANYNALVRLFLVGMGLPVLAESNFLNWQEVNDWERIADIGKTMLENMEQEYRYCGMENSGGDRLL